MFFQYPVSLQAGLGPLLDLPPGGIVTRTRSSASGRAPALGDVILRRRGPTAAKEPHRADLGGEGCAKIAPPPHHRQSVAAKSHGRRLLPPLPGARVLRQRVKVIAWLMAALRGQGAAQ
jgi:hypothetical protein